MFVAVDIGNSNIVVGIYHNKEWKHLWRWETHEAETELFYTSHIANAFLESGLAVSSTDKIGMCSVVPEITLKMQQALQKLFRKEVYMLEPAETKKIHISKSQCREIGSDLVANSIAGYRTFSEGCIIVDFGTALTFTVVSGKGNIIGVNILPGIKTAIKALHGNTSKLPHVPIQLPNSKIGKDTITAIQSGVLWGYTGLIREMIKMIREEMMQDLPVIATGGLSTTLVTLKEDFAQIRPELTLEGLRIEFTEA